MSVLKGGRKPSDGIAAGQLQSRVIHIGSLGSFLSATRERKRTPQAFQDSSALGANLTISLQWRGQLKPIYGDDVEKQAPLSRLKVY